MTAMEVHHHPSVEQKGFKSYVLEGVMIFLAVTMGFIAESLREYSTDKAKEREYVISLVSDLKKDSMELEHTIHDNQRKIVYQDSLLMLYNADLTKLVNLRRLYHCANLAVNFLSSFISNDATMMQLKNSGGLQLIKSRHVADSVAKYDLEMRAVYSAQTEYEKANQGAMDALQGILFYPAMEDTPAAESGAQGEAKLLTLEEEKWKLFFNKVYFDRGWTQNYVNNMQDKVPYNMRLIAFLQREYGIEK
jgi:hypothetical protein